MVWSKGEKLNVEKNFLQCHFVHHILCTSENKTGKSKRDNGIVK
jgi:hypothetical protein